MRLILLSLPPLLLTCTVCQGPTCTNSPYSFFPPCPKSVSFDMVWLCNLASNCWENS